MSPQFTTFYDLMTLCKLFNQSEQTKQTIVVRYISISLLNIYVKKELPEK